MISVNFDNDKLNLQNVVKNQTFKVTLQVCRENLLIFDTLPGVIAWPNILTFVFPTSATVSVFPFIGFYFPSLNSRQLSFSNFLLFS